MKLQGQTRKITLFLSFLVIGVLVYLFIIYREELSSFPWEINIYFLLLLFLFHTLAMAPTFLVWHLMVSKIGRYNNFKANLKYYYLSALAKRLPTSVPYLGGRIYLYDREGISNAAILNCSVLETLLFSIGGIIAYFLLQPFYKSSSNEISSTLTILGVIIVTVTIAWPKLLLQITNWALARLNKQSLTSFPNRKDLILWISIYVIPWFISGYAFYLVPKALTNYINLDFIDAYKISTISTLASQLYIILPGGLAIRELTASALLTQFMTIPIAIVISILYRITQTINEILMALVVVITVQWNRKEQ